MTKTDFVEAFRGIYESSPWIVDRAFESGPFAGIDDLRTCLRRVVEESSVEEQIALINAHPDLGGKLAREGQLTAESSREQSRLGLERLDEESFQTMTRLNREYRARFHFPFVICVGLLQDRAEIFDAFRSRILHSLEEERQEALRQIHLIAGLRLSAILQP